MSKIKYLVVHCAATRPSMDIDSYDIDKWHKAKKWSGCGYHVVIARNGDIQTAAKGFPTRPMHRRGAHTLGINKHSKGICLVGGVEEEDIDTAENNFTAAQMASLAIVLDDLEEAYPNAKVMGHRDIIAEVTKGSPKACPSFDVREWRENWKNQTIEVSPKSEPEVATTVEATVSPWVLLGRFIISIFKAKG